MEFNDLNTKKMGKRLKDRREALDMSRAELGKMLSVTGKFIADIECGNKGMSLKNFHKIKQILGLSADYILDGGDAYQSTMGEQIKISENILGSLSVCSAEQLSSVEKITRIYVESIVDK